MYIFSSLFTYMVVWVSDFVMVNILLWCVCVCVCVCVSRVTRPCYITRHGCVIFQTIKKFTIMCILFTC